MKTCGGDDDDDDEDDDDDDDYADKYTYRCISTFHMEQTSKYANLS